MTLFRIFDPIIFIILVLTDDKTYIYKSKKGIFELQSGYNFYK